MILVVMGVTGSGKTTVGELLADATGWQFAEGDAYHSDVNRKKMHEGIPLTDEDRLPWLERLHQLLLRWYQSGTSGILTCSALKQSYRDLLSAQIPQANLRFIFLDVPRTELEQRLAHRTGHYMNPALLDSQMETLEVPQDAMRIAATQSPKKTVQQILDRLLQEEGLPQL